MEWGEGGQVWAQVIIAASHSDRHAGLYSPLLHLPPRLNRQKVTFIYSHVAHQPHGAGTTEAGRIPSRTCDRTKHKVSLKQWLYAGVSPICGASFRKPTLRAAR